MSAAAERTRRYRQRLRRGCVVLRVEVDDVALAQVLVAGRFLALQEAESLDAMARALERVVSQMIAADVHEAEAVQPGLPSHVQALHRLPGAACQQLVEGGAVSAAAERTRRYRQRLRRGRVVLRIEVDEVALAQVLVAGKFLALEEAESLDAMARALERVVSQMIAADVHVDA